MEITVFSDFVLTTPSWHLYIRWVSNGVVGSQAFAAFDQGTSFEFKPSLVYGFCDCLFLMLRVLNRYSPIRSGKLCQVSNGECFHSENSTFCEVFYATLEEVCKSHIAMDDDT